MAQQSNKKIKRRRRAEYLKRKKELAKLGSVLPKASVKKAAAKEADVADDTTTAKKAVKKTAKKAVKKAPAKKVAKETEEVETSGTAEKTEAPETKADEKE